MNETSAFPAEPGHPKQADRGVLIWDLPVRVFHWLLVLDFAVAWLTAESEQWRLVHVISGYTVAALVAFRLLWGLVGTRHARFSSFVRGPRAVREYLGNLVRGRHKSHAGHNPAGALAIMALLALAVLTTASGWAFYNETGGEWLEEVHEVLANLMVGLVLLHVAAVLVTSLLARDNLVKAMWTGRKKGAERGDAIGRPWRGVGILMLVAVLGFWWFQWTDPGNVAGGPSLSRFASERHHQGDDD